MKLCTCAVVFCITLAWVAPLSADVFTLLHTLDDPTPTTFDGFGGAVAVSADYALVADPADGLAHLFDAHTAALLRSFDYSGGSLFGAGCVDLDLDLALVGGGGRTDVYRASTGALIRTFHLPGDATVNADRVLIQDQLYDAFSGNLLQTFPGASGRVALDGNHVLIGTNLYDAASGALRHTFHDPTPTTHDMFGYCVDVDGDYILIGAPRDDTNHTDGGQAHLFDAVTGDLLHTFNDPSPVSLGFYIGDEFGTSVAIDDGLVLIGVPFSDTDRDHPPGIPDYNDVGQAHLFSARTGELLQDFDDPSPAHDDWFGFSVDIADGHVLIANPFDDTLGRDIGQAHLNILVPTPIAAAAGLILFAAALGPNRRRAV